MPTRSGYVDAVAPEHVDVLIVGAGLSGIGAACQLREHHPTRSVAVLEAREASGGTWDLFKYPGIRSDSDMFTLGYPFRPWTGDKAIADGPSILDYVVSTAREAGIDKRIRFGHRITRASWPTDEARWTVEVERGSEVLQVTEAEVVYVGIDPTNRRPVPLLPEGKPLPSGYWWQGFRRHYCRRHHCRSRRDEARQYHSAPGRRKVRHPRT